MTSDPPRHDQTVSGTSARDGSQAFAGTVNGNVYFGSTTSGNAPRDDSLRPLSTTPFRRDVDFVGRVELLSQVDDLCSQPGGRAALVGLGGVGKSQIAIEFTHRIREHSPMTWVFWVHASNASRFEQGWRDIARMVKVPGANDPKCSIFEPMHDWLLSSNEKWLVVLDNVDDARFLVDMAPAVQGDTKPARPLREYLPQSPNGSILVTSRNREAALTLVESKEIIEVDPMSEASAVKLLGKKLTSHVSPDMADRTALVSLLEYMPLAVVHAAAFITKRASRYSVQQYIEEFQRSDRKKSKLLDAEGQQLRRDHEAKNSIMITWQISFEHIRITRQSAADLLALMSFFDSQGIPESLIRRRSSKIKHTEGNEGEGDEDADSDTSEEDGFEEDVQILRDFSFVSLKAGLVAGSVFEMHKLVQLATRTWLQANELFETWKQHSIEQLVAEVPDGEYHNWDKCAAYFPHVRLACTQRPVQRQSLLQWASVMINGAWYAASSGHVAIALEISTKAMKVRRDLLGQEDTETLDSMELLGWVYDMAGRPKESEQLAVQVMETRSKVLGPDHPDTLTAMNNLAVAWTDGDQQQLKEAERLAMQVLRTRERLLGLDHPKTMISVNNLANVYGKQRRWEEEEKLERRALESRTRTAGPDHPDTLNSIHNLASACGQQGRLAEAEQLQRQALETRRRVLGPDHPDSLMSLNNLSFILAQKGELESAIALAEECVERQKIVLGPSHPSTKHTQDDIDIWRLKTLKLSPSNA